MGLVPGYVKRAHWARREASPRRRRFILDQPRVGRETLNWRCLCGAPQRFVAGRSL